MEGEPRAVEDFAEDFAAFGKSEESILLVGVSVGRGSVQGLRSSALKSLRDILQTHRWLGIGL